jgi:hypothetical protein
MKISIKAFDARLQSLHIVKKTREECNWTFHNTSMR